MDSPAGHSCSYALNNTGSVFAEPRSFRSAAMNTKTDLMAICAADTTDMFIFFEVRGSSDARGRLQSSVNTFADARFLTAEVRTLR